MVISPIPADVPLERQLIWLSMAGGPHHKQAIFSRCAPSMFEAEAGEVFKVARELYAAGKPFQMPEVAARMKDKTGKDLPIHFWDGADFSYGAPGPLIDSLVTRHHKRNLALHLEAAASNLEHGDPLEIARTLRDSLPAEETPEEMVFRPSWTNQPEAVDHVLTLNGHRIGSAGNLSLLIAGHGHGKSAVCEALAASVLNPECDSFGLKVNTLRSVVYLDTERSKADHWAAWSRMAKRANIPSGGDCSRVHFELISMIPGINGRQGCLSRILQDVNPGLVILDGLGDFVLDTNDPLECNAWIFSLMAAAKEKGFSIFGTLHPNPNDTINRKARGHLGSELMRRSESVLLLQKDETGQRTLGMDFTHGKNRSAADNLETFFFWDTMMEMFATCPDARPATKPAARERHVELLRMLDGKEYTFTDIVSAIEKGTGRKKGAARQLLYRLRDKGSIIQKGLLWEVKNDAF